MNSVTSWLFLKIMYSFSSIEKIWHFLKRVMIH